MKAIKPEPMGIVKMLMKLQQTYYSIQKLHTCTCSKMLNSADINKTTEFTVLNLRTKYFTILSHEKI